MILGISLRSILTATAWLYFIAVVGTVGAMFFLSEVWWLATVLLYAPRWMSLLPLALMVPVLIARAWAGVGALVAAGVLAVFFAMGFELPSPSVVTGDRARSDLRVMSYNVGLVGAKSTLLPGLLKDFAPDVAVFQECSTLVNGAKSALESDGWFVDVQYGSCIASRYPIRAIDAHDVKIMWKTGGSGILVRYELAMPNTNLNIVNLHLETVRDGLSAVARRAFWQGIPKLEANTRQRAFEAGAALQWTKRATGPLVVTGDFNMPVESTIYQRHWSTFTNAFSEAGFGFGYTKATRWHGARIDHILLGRDWQCVGAFVGGHLGGDHRPVIADLRLRAGASSD